MTTIQIGKDVNVPQQDIDGITKAITDYMMPWYGAGYDGLAEAIHPSIHKRVFRYDPHTGRAFMSEVNHFQLMEIAKNSDVMENKPPESVRQNDILIYHATDRIASARSEGHRWVDFLHLAKLEGRWQIMHILFDNKREGTYPDAQEPIIQAVENYMMPWYTLEWERLASALHPAVIKRGFNKDSVSGRMVILNSPYTKLVENVRGASTHAEPKPEEERVCEIEVQGIFQNVASVKAVGSTWVDYIHLQYLKGEWKIINIFYDQL